MRPNGAQLTKSQIGRSRKLNPSLIKSMILIKPENSCNICQYWTIKRKSYFKDRSHKNTTFQSYLNCSCTVWTIWILSLTTRSPYFCYHPHLNLICNFHAYDPILSTATSRESWTHYHTICAVQPTNFRSVSITEQHFRMRAEFRLWHTENDLFYAMFERAEDGKQKRSYSCGWVPNCRIKASMIWCHVY